jgi:hypothetical protein
MNAHLLRVNQIKLRELYNSDSAAQATYANFRRFETSARIIP